MLESTEGGGERVIILHSIVWWVVKVILGSMCFSSKLYGIQCLPYVVLLLSDTNMSVEWWYTIIGLESLNSWCIHMVFWSTLPQHCLINTSPTLSDQHFPNIVWSTLPQHCLINTSPTITGCIVLPWSWWLFVRHRVLITYVWKMGWLLEISCQNQVLITDIWLMCWNFLSDTDIWEDRLKLFVRHQGLITDIRKIGWNFLSGIRG